MHHQRPSSVLVLGFALFVIVSKIQYVALKHRRHAFIMGPIRMERVGSGSDPPYADPNNSSVINSGSMSEPKSGLNPRAHILT